MNTYEEDQINKIKVFYVTIHEQTKDTYFWDQENNLPKGEGWYYQENESYILPDSDPYGPFLSEKDAVQDLRQWYFDE